MRRYLCLSVFLCGSLFSQTLEKDLQRLTDEVGGRRTGSPAMRRAVTWGVDAFKQAGVDRVTTEAFKVPQAWSEGPTRLDILGAASFRARTVAIGWSPATPAEGLTARVVDAGEGSVANFQKLGDAGKDAFVLIHSGLLHKWEDLFGEYMNAPGVIERATGAGAKGILWMSSREKTLLYRHVGTMAGKVEGLPQAIVAREDALRIARLIAAGSTVRAKLTMPNVVGGPFEQRNVVAEIRGTEKPDEVVILGAHLDSWELGTGALDNGCNSALVVDVARRIKAAGAPKRTVRFILFSGEEQGMLGSQAYVKAHAGEMDKIVAIVIHDTGSGKMTGYSLGGRADIKDAVSAILPGEHTLDAILGTDNLDFLLAGVPNLVANQVEANYLENYHASSDTYDKVDFPTLNEITASALKVVTGIANLPERIGKRQSKAEVQKLLRDTGLDQQMKLFGIKER